MKTSEHNVRFVLVYLFICAKAHVTISLLFSSLQQSAFILLGTFIYLCSGLWFTFSVRFLCMREFGFFFCVAFPMYFRLYLWYAFKLLNFLLLLKLMFVSFSFWVHVTWSHKGWDRSFCFLCIYFGICMRCAVVVPFFLFLLNAIQRFSFRFADNGIRENSSQSENSQKYAEEEGKNTPANVERNIIKGYIMTCRQNGRAHVVPYPRVTTNNIYTQTHCSFKMFHRLDI